MGRYSFYLPPFPFSISTVSLLQTSLLLFASAVCISSWLFSCCVNSLLLFPHLHKLWAPSLSLFTPCWVHPWAYSSLGWIHPLMSCCGHVPFFCCFQMLSNFFLSLSFCFESCSPSMVGSLTI